MTAEEVTATIRANLEDIARELGCPTKAAFARILWPAQNDNTAKLRLHRFYADGWICTAESALEIAAALELTVGELYARLLAPRGAL